MKLRMRANSLRLRLTQSEVAEISAGNAVEERIEFGGEPAQRLVYALIPSDDFESPTAVFEAGRIAVFIPRPQAAKWALATDEIGIAAVQQVNEPGSMLRILIEKDFTCLKTRAGGDDTDTFAHPFQSKAGSGFLC